MREYFEECENPETCGESFGEKWGRLRKQLRDSIVWANRDDNIGDPMSYWRFTVLKMMNNIEYLEEEGDLEARDEL